MSLKFGTSGIRGLNTEFNEKTVRAYITAFIQYAETKTSVGKIAIGGDLRESTPGIQRMVEEILNSLGSKPLDCGKLPTPALALYCIEKKVPGIMITGSHIPADRNGIKFYWPWGEILKEDELEIVNRFDFIYSKIIKEFNEEHQFVDEASNLYIERYTNFFSPYREKFKGKKTT